ncbi:MAG: cupin domain-containing protein [Litorimonas sp.]
MPRINSSDVTVTTGTNYPPELNSPCEGRAVERLSQAGGITQFGAYRVTLPPPPKDAQSWASQRHHHSAEDEFIYVLSGRPTLIDDAGETQLRPGDSCAHPAGDGNGHHLINTTHEPVTFLIVGTKNPQNDHCRYPDADLDLPANGTSQRQQFRKDGTPIT